MIFLRFSWWITNIVTWTHCRYPRRVHTSWYPYRESVWGSHYTYTGLRATPTGVVTVSHFQGRSRRIQIWRVDDHYHCSLWITSILWRVPFLKEQTRVILSHSMYPHVTTRTQSPSPKKTFMTSSHSVSVHQKTYKKNMTWCPCMEK
jgi:hypothetical protein